MFNTVEDFYTTPGDLNIDMYDAALVIKALLAGNSTVVAASDGVTQAIASAVIKNFAAAGGNPKAKGLAIHFVKLTAAGVIDNPPHDQAYIKGSSAQYPLAFVQDAGSTWVPTVSSFTSLLDRIWYEVY